MATQLITPADLYRNQVLTRYAGSLSDPYGLSKALGSVGAGYGDMNRELTTGAGAFDAVSKSLAGEAAGLPGLQADQAAAASRLATNTSTDALHTQQTIEAAFQAAISAGLKPGTPEFHDYMLAHVNTAGAAAKITPDVAKGNLQRQTQDVQARSMKTAIDKYIRDAVVKRYVTENKDQAIQAADIAGIPRQQAVKQLLQYANSLGDQAVEKIGANVIVDPATGFIKAMDVSGKPFEIPPAVLAAGYAMGGNKVPFDVFQKLTTDQQKAVQQQNLNERTAGLLQHYQTEQDKSLQPKVPAKEVIDPYTNSRLNEFQKLKALYYKAVQDSRKEGGAPVPKELEEEYKVEKAWRDSLHDSRNKVPQSAVITSNDAAGIAPFQAPTSYDYGIPAGPEYAGSPEAVDQMPPEQPGLSERFGNFLNNVNPFSAGFSPNYGIPPIPE